MEGRKNEQLVLLYFLDIHTFALPVTKFER